MRLVALADTVAGQMLALATASEQQPAARGRCRRKTVFPLAQARALAMKKGRFRKGSPFVVDFLKCVCCTISCSF